ncbi:hypothetical protein [Algoriphagus terrigena]
MNFNSRTVRLRAGGVDKACGELIGFNSSMVRLKVVRDQDAGRS